MEINELLNQINNNILFITVLVLLLILLSLSKGRKEFNYSRRELNYHEERNFFTALRLSATEHGYNFPFPTFRFFGRRLLNHFLQIFAKNVPYSGFRIILQRMRGVTVEEKVHIGPSVFIDDVYPEYVKISKGASIAGFNTFLTHTKPLTYHDKIVKSTVDPIIIGESAWISIGATLLPGVKVGKGSIVAAGSVVTKDVPDNVMVAGVPAKIIKKFKMEKNKPIGLNNPSGRS